MSKYSPRYAVRYRRRREGRTDYRQRIKLIRSRRPRLVVRSSLKHIRAQVVFADSAGDRTVASAFSKELLQFGWKGYTGNLPAAYLTGLLCGYRAEESGVDECVLDIGRHVNTPRTKVFATLKGALDAGLAIPHKEEVLPPDERVRGEHIARYANELKSKNKAYRRQFARYLENDLHPENLPDRFERVKHAIVEKYG